MSSTYSVIALALSGLNTQVIEVNYIEDSIYYMPIVPYIEDTCEAIVKEHEANWDACEVKQKAQSMCQPTRPQRLASSYG